MKGHGGAGWHPEEIKAALRMRHGAITHLSLTWGYNRAAISNTIRSPTYSVEVERRIAQALGQPPHAIWPDRWSPAGEPWSRSIIRVDPSRSALPAHRQKLEAA